MQLNFPAVKARIDVNVTILNYTLFCYEWQTICQAWQKY